MSKNNSDFITNMRQSGQILREILNDVIRKAAPGVNGLELDQFAESQIRKNGAVPSFKNFQGFPASLCVSINEAVVHGMPSKKPFEVGDIIGLDLGLSFSDAYTDTAKTVIVTENGVQTYDDIIKIDQSKRTKDQQLLFITAQSLELGISAARARNHVGDIGFVVQKLAKKHNLGVIRQLVGHGVGHEVHEYPSIPNFGSKGSGAILTVGQTIAIEPMFSLGNWRIKTAQDGWTANTVDHSRAAHFEHTILITANDAEVLT